MTFSHFLLFVDFFARGWWPIGNGRTPVGTTVGMEVQIGVPPRLPAYARWVRPQVFPSLS